VNPVGATAAPSPFTVAIPERDVDDLRQRLRRTRFADDFANESWSYGVPGDYLRSRVEYWLDEYDWRRAEREINAVPAFRTQVDDVPIHYVHVRGAGPAPMPLILTHGWPWTFWDFHKVIGPLADPAAHGGDPADAFDVVVPSLPGFGFSSPLRRTGMHPGAVAELWSTLMTQVLGYERFAAQGGDWGAFVTAWLGHAHADRVLGVHQSMPAFITVASGSLRADDFDEDERGRYESMRAKAAGIASHLAVHTHDPQTLAWALNDSPAGLLAWLVERRRAWSDCGGDVESRFSKDDLLTTTSIYWFTQTFHTSARMYADTRRSRPGPVHDRMPEIEVPTAIAVFPEDVIQYPRAVAERHADLRQWTVMPRGGHFAPMEEPGALVDDVRRFFRGLR
jgi:pimeloyl-ACP methyl ester carboxylesterase